MCIEYDARRKLYGAALVVAMEDEARLASSRSLTLRCGFDLDANQFWKEMGYGCVSHKTGGVRRMRTINVWRKSLAARLFDEEFIEPAIGKTSAAIWSKHKHAGLVTQFVRGARLDEYRRSVIASSKI